LAEKDKKPQRLVAVIYPQAGGYIARIMPPGIVCFSENLDGLKKEIETAVENYSAEIDEMDSEASADFTFSSELAGWEDAVNASNVFMWDLDELFWQ